MHKNVCNFDTFMNQDEQPLIFYRIYSNMKHVEMTKNFVAKHFKIYMEGKHKHIHTQTFSPDGGSCLIISIQDSCILYGFLHKKIYSSFKTRFPMI